MIDIKALAEKVARENEPSCGDALEVVGQRVRAFRPATDDHAVNWKHSAWGGGCATEVTDRVHRLAEQLREKNGGDCDLVRISRRDVFALADADPVDLFLAAMAWGFGDVGYGWYRTNNVIEHAGEDRIARAIETIRKANQQAEPIGAWRAWSRAGEAKLPGLGTAFASKLAYFACFDRATGTGPLIADANTAWGLWGLTGIWDSRAKADRYGEYVEWASAAACSIGCRPDDVERALFEIGPVFKEAWRARKVMDAGRRDGT